MTKSNGKAALITGSTDGVGRVVAKRLADGGSGSVSLMSYRAIACGGATTALVPPVYDSNVVSFARLTRHLDVSTVPLTLSMNCFASRRESSTATRVGGVVLVSSIA